MSDFTSQYGTNLAATVTMLIIAGIIWCVKHKLRHSQCSMDTRFFKCSADDKSTLRSQPGALRNTKEPKATSEV